MKATLTIDGANFGADFSAPFDLAWPLHFQSPDKNPSAFSLPKPTAKPIAGDGYTLDVAQGGSVNCFELMLCSHGAGTHTECRGHILPEGGDIHSELRQGLLPTTLVTVHAERMHDGIQHLGKTEAGDKVISARLLQNHPMLLAKNSFTGAVIVRTQTSTFSPPDFSGANPIYFSVGAITYLRDLGCTHLITDLPSIDREDDGGTTPSHHVFFAGSDERSITELARIPMNVADGHYALDLQIPPFVFESAPSRPRVYPLDALEKTS